MLKVLVTGEPEERAKMAAKPPIFASLLKLVKGPTHVGFVQPVVFQKCLVMFYKV